jgi:hypothetical protein
LSEETAITAGSEFVRCGFPGTGPSDLLDGKSIR